MKNQPTKTDWERLYKSAEAFRDLAPWDWTDEDRIFGVKNLETGQIDYCSVLGGSGELFALIVYEGHQGLQGYLKLLLSELEERLYVIEHQRAFMASFENRDALESKDLAVIRSLNLKFHGKKAWPMFRHYLPGHWPWFLLAPQAQTLADCLDQSLDVFRRYRQNPNLLGDPESDSHLVRICDDRGMWHDEILPAPVFGENSLPDVSVDEIGLAKIQSQGKKHYGTWEIGYCYAPTPIQESRDSRPYFPRLLGIVDNENGMILGFELEEPENHLPSFRDRIMSCLENMEVLPENFLVDHDQAEALVKPIAMFLDINLHRVPELPAFTVAIDEMTEIIR
jgi:hypothetical protein